MYVKITNGAVDQYPYTIGHLRRDNPNVSLPRVLPQRLLDLYGLKPVTIEETPDYDDRTQNIEQNSTPTEVDGVWTVGWTISEKSADDIALYDTLKEGYNRDIRNSELTASDWTQLPDSSADTTAWATYRQALRDITSHENWPNLSDDDWPTKP